MANKKGNPTFWMTRLDREKEELDKIKNPPKIIRTYNTVYAGVSYVVKVYEPGYARGFDGCKRYR